MKRREYSQPSLPAVLAHAGIIGDTVDASRAVLAFVVDALVDVKRAVVLGVTRRTLAYVAVDLIEAITIVLAVRVEAQLAANAIAMSGVIVTLQLQELQRGEVRILINFFICKVVQQHAADTHFAETALKRFSCVQERKDEFLISRKRI